MNKKDVLAGYLQVLDEINQSINSAIETLNTNSSIVKTLIEEILYGEEEKQEDITEKIGPDLFSKYQSNDSSPSTYEEELANQIVEQMLEGLDNNGEPKMINVVIDETKADYETVMQLVKEKFKNAGTNREDDIDDEFNF